MEEFKIASYTEQRLDNKSLMPTGRKVKKYCIYKKKFPFPNKSIFLWDEVKSNFKTEKEANNYLKDIIKECTED